MTTTLEQVIDRAEPVGFSNAATLLRFAAKVVRLGIEEKARWVVMQAIDAAEKELRDAVDGGDDVNVVDSRVAALRLRFNLSFIRDVFTAGAMADDEFYDFAVGAADVVASQTLENAAKECYSIALGDNGTRA